MTATAQGAEMRCDYAGCTKAGAVEVDAWAYCTDHAGREHLDALTTPRPRPTAVADKRPRVDLATVTSDESAHGIRAATPSPIALLLEQASGHSVGRVRKTAERIEAQLDGLRALIAEHAADERRRQADAAAKAKARADIDRLTMQLAAAKAALRGTPATHATPAARPTWSKTNPRPCSNCGHPSKPSNQPGHWPALCSACRAAA